MDTGAEVVPGEFFGLAGGEYAEVFGMHVQALPERTLEHGRGRPAVEAVLFRAGRGIANRAIELPAAEQLPTENVGGHELRVRCLAAGGAESLRDDCAPRQQRVLLGDREFQAVGYPAV